MRIEAVEFDFNGKRVIVAKNHFTKDGYRSTWVDVKTMSTKVQLKFKDVGNQRWLCYAEVPTIMLDEFETWLTEHLENRFMFTKVFEIESGNVKRIFELRGGDPQDKMLLALRWS